MEGHGRLWQCCGNAVAMLWHIVCMLCASCSIVTIDATSARAPSAVPSAVPAVPCCSEQVKRALAHPLHRHGCRRCALEVVTVITVVTLMPQIC